MKKHFNDILKELENSNYIVSHNEDRSVHVYTKVNDASKLVYILVTVVDAMTDHFMEKINDAIADDKKAKHFNNSVLIALRALIDIKINDNILDETKEIETELKGMIEKYMEEKCMEEK